MEYKTASNSYKIDAVIVNWNSGKHLKTCIESLKTQTVRFNSIIVVDNGSTDGSIDDIECGDSVVKVLHVGRNLGFAGGCNYGISESEFSEWVALVNPDALLEPEWLQYMIDAINRNKEASFFASCILNASIPNLLDGMGDDYHMSGLVWRKWHGVDANNIKGTEKEVFSPCAAAALYRRAAILDIGGFDEDFFCYVEDVDLGFRLRLMGHHCVVVPDAIAHHIGSATTGGKHSDFAVYYGQRNIVWAFLKNMPGILFWLLLPLHIIINVANILRFTFYGKGSVVLKAKWDAIMEIPTVWKKRREIQLKRISPIIGIWRALDKRLLPRHYSS